MEEILEIIGAREHNLKDITVSIPRNQLVVITGLSGSGKSSLAFDTIYAEGQRRYMETFGAYARQFLGELERPDVDKINGLSPVISIEQKTVSKNPRSTVGTITEIYDFMRLLFSRAADAYSFHTGERMVRYSDEQIVERITQDYAGSRISVLAPLVKGRKGHYRELFESIQKQGFVKVRVDGELIDLHKGMKIDRYKIHDIEVVVDRLAIQNPTLAPAPQEIKRIRDAVQTALRLGKGSMLIVHHAESSKKKAAGDQAVHFSRHLMCPTTGISYAEPEPNLFSFNSPYGACHHCNGLGEVAEIDLTKLIPDKSKSIKQGGLAPLGEWKSNWTFQQVEGVLKHFSADKNIAVGKLDEDVIHALLYGLDEKIEVKAGHQTYQVRFEGLLQLIEKQVDEDSSPAMRRWAESFMNKMPCPECGGARLKREALFFKIGQYNIYQLAAMGLHDLEQWFSQADALLDKRQKAIATEPLKEIRSRLQFLINVGLEYLTLNRSARTLSGGEAQRIRLATQIGSQLVGVLYILDEPSIGLHQRDNHKLIQSLKDLRDGGNSVMVVEHDEDMMLESDHLIDIGPGAGIHGGRVMTQGHPKELLQGDSITAKYLRGEMCIPIPEERRKGRPQWLKLRGATGHNLKNVDLQIPLGKFVCVTGVSGSGKSSLIEHTLYPILNAHFYNGVRKPLPYKSIHGLENLDKVIEIDQSPIGRTPRSNPSTYTGVFSEIRNLFANAPEAKIRGYQPGRFSFNVSGGRCETCKGAGVKTIEMNFLPDVLVHCEECNGKRYNRETLEIRYKGKSISDVLDMTVDQAVDFFESFPKIKHVVKTLQDVGLGYITLGQHSTTLSGGEAQRVKLSTELGKRDTGNTLYILDEPTTGLHFQDVNMLIQVLNRLCDRGNSVLVIEHNMDMIKVADYIIDIGPEGGAKGGQIIASGTPEEVAKVKQSWTGQYLQRVLKKKALIE